MEKIILNSLFMLKKKILPVVAWLLTAFIIMTAFEFTNSFIFPFPEWMDMYNSADVQEFIKNLPHTAYIMVLLWWMIGSFLAWFVTTKLSKEKVYKLSLIVGIILTILGVINNLMIGHTWWFNIVWLPMFLIFSYFGHTIGRK